MGNDKPPPLTMAILVKAWEKLLAAERPEETAQERYYIIPPPNLHNRHKDYLPLNMWDEVP